MLRSALVVVVHLVVWLLVSAVAGLAFFLTSERSVDVASHTATLRPDFSGYAVVRTGPVFPDFRLDTDTPVGVTITLGDTTASSLPELGRRYAAIGSNPDGQIDAVRRSLTDMAVDSGVRGLAVGLLPLIGWHVVGRERRRQLWRRLPTRAGLVGAGAVVLVGAGLTQPWESDPPAADPGTPRAWQPLSAFVGPGVPLPGDLDGVEAAGGAAAQQTRRLVQSALSTYEKSQAFYDVAAADATMLDLRQPREDETVALLVSDRHDNVGMDRVARAIGDRAGATAVLNAGDDTSTGQSWEAFSLDSLNAAFDDVSGRWAVAGNHDHGGFVRDRLSGLGWTYFDDEVVDGPGDSRILGIDDPRASGLGDWRQESGLSFDEVRQRLADAACEADERGDRVNTLLVHDANLGRAALTRGCVDLVLGGHTHVQAGPTEVIGTDGTTGYTYTVGTTGGAAYAIATGSKPRRQAGVALVTYRDGRPVGIQSVGLETNGAYVVGDYERLTYADEAEEEPAS
ncbi:metallophosphoesterase [Nocardioides panacisoli]|uniref:metallophosphoesterase family protein n=1 Tax=Nocardioides panacisoli TaxID=627624 RepID=UPI001C6331E2|nr:metallophosphoesterase [Nocardioides panacisoli]QYJ02690.1 metallophosphoesterase [Nocardioides panacisoli]